MYMNVNKACNELGRKKYYEILISIEVLMYMTNHLRGSYVILKWNFYLFSLVYNSLVNAFYFYKYSHVFKLINHDWM